MKFVHGDTVYGPNGAALIFNHEHEGVAYCHPMMVVQTTNYRGDDFEEHEVATEHLVALPLRSITPEPPVAMLASEVKALRSQIADLNAEKQTLSKSLSDLRREEMDTINRVARQKAQTPRFDEIARLREGETLYPLIVPSWKYRVDLPIIAEPDQFEVLTLIHTGGGKFKWKGHWRPDGGHHDDKHPVDVEIFHTMEDLQDFVTILWGKVLEHFAKTPRDVQYGRVSGTGHMVTYDFLKKWVTRFDHCAIPDSVRAERISYEAENKEELLRQARDRVRELEGS